MFIIPTDLLPWALGELEAALTIPLEDCDELIAGFNSPESMIEWLLLMSEEPALRENAVRKAVEAVSRRISREESATRKNGVDAICWCQAREHGLAGNCLECGKIICNAEADGCACHSCGSFRVSLADAPDETPENEIARLAKDKLVSFEREGAARTRVLDDSADWFEAAGDVWRPAAARAEAAARGKAAEEEISRKKKEFRIRLNFESDKVTVEHEDRNAAVEEIHRREKEEISRLMSQVEPAPILTDEKQNKLRAESEALLEALKISVQTLPVATQPNKKPGNSKLLKGSPAALVP